jgi:hypothetical protein
VGGVIGDDGLDGIVFDPASPAREAFKDWQRYIKRLCALGVIPGRLLKERSRRGRKRISPFEFDSYKVWFRRVRVLLQRQGRRAAAHRRLPECRHRPPPLLRRQPGRMRPRAAGLPEVAVVCLGAHPAGFIDAPVRDIGADAEDLVTYETEAA